MPNARNLFLIGPRASGKTSLGRLLAARLGLHFVDTDELAAQRAGMSIADLVAGRGWDAFRRIEHDILTEVCARTGQVAATGGGIVLWPENRALLSQAGTVFYLHAAADVLAARLTRDPLPGQRPSLTGASPAEELAHIAAEREPLYRACADHVLDAALPPAALCETAAASLNQTSARK